MQIRDRGYTQLRDRKQAGIMLARCLKPYAGKAGAIVLALPRGGVPVGFEIAKSLHLPLDVFLVRKLGMPGHEELAIGAIASGGVRVLNRHVAPYLLHYEVVVDAITRHEEKELKRRMKAYRDDKPFPDIKDKTIILTDDGLATGSTMRVALLALRRQLPRRIVVALPVAPLSVYDDLPEADEIVCLMTPEPFYGVGAWYGQFDQISDLQVQHLLREAEKFMHWEAA